MGLDNPLHIAFLLLVLLLICGAKRLPEMGKSLGSGMRGFKSALADEAEPAALVSADATAPKQAAVVSAEATAPRARSRADPGAPRGLAARCRLRAALGRPGSAAPS